MHLTVARAHFEGHTRVVHNQGHWIVLAIRPEPELLNLVLSQRQLQGDRSNTRTCNFMGLI